LALVIDCYTRQLLGWHTGSIPVANHKRVHRLCREAGLAVRKRHKRERVAVERCPLQVPSGPNHTWSMDSVFDALANGRPIKCLTVVDDCTKEAVELAVARRINGQGVAAASAVIPRQFAPTKG
jgi:putative transposase